MVMNKVKKFTLSQQYAALKKSYPDFIIKLSKSCITVNGLIKPTSRSIDYLFKLKYTLGKGPEVNIIDPILKRNFKNEKIPHLYPGNELCLYYPKFQEFNSTKLISDFIIPWISLWLYHYENWHITGIWEGGGVHPTLKKKKISKSKTKY
jgi:hypothetical protein